MVQMCGRTSSELKCTSILYQCVIDNDTGNYSKKRKIFLHALSVERVSHIKETFTNTREFTLERNCIHALNVVKVFLIHQISVFTCTFTLKKKHLTVISVVKILFHHRI